jgi:DNA polymerase-3 subunit epsilon
MRLQSWPYSGPISIREGQSWHVIDGWAYLGTARSKSAIAEVLKAGRRGFDRDVYRLLATRMDGLKQRIDLIDVACQ